MMDINMKLNKEQRKFLLDEFLSEDVARLKKEIQKLKYERDCIKFGTYNTNRGRKLNETQLDAIRNSLVPITCHLIRQVNKIDLQEIILLREKLLYDKINEFNDSLKHNDREVFKTLKAENERLKSYLINENQAYAELQELRVKYNRLKIKKSMKKWPLK